MVASSEIQTMDGRRLSLSPTQARLALALLTLVYVFNFIDRQILNILAESIAKELHLSDTQIGLMTGLAFAAFYTVLGIPLARYADDPRVSRIKLMSVCLAIWSGMTAASGLAQTYSQLLLAQIGVGAGEAGCTPAAISVIADVFPKEKRASAMGVYMAGVPIGSLIGLVLGGLLADALGWRHAFMIVGIPGVILAVVLWLVLREPRRFGLTPALQAERPAPLGEVLRALAASRTYRLLILANSVGAFLSYGKGVWQIIFFIRSFHLTAGQVGLALGLTGGLCGLLGSFFGGRIGDRLGARCPGLYFRVPAVAHFLSVPLLVCAYLSSDWRVALGFLVLPSLFATLNYGPSMAVTQGIFPRAPGPPRPRSSSSSRPSSGSAWGRCSLV